MAVIRSGSNLLKVDSSGAARVRTPATSSYRGLYRPLGSYAAASYRLAGTATNPINLLTVRNHFGSQRRVILRRITVDVGISSAATAFVLTPHLRLWLDTGVQPSGGTVADKFTEFGEPSAPTTEILFPTSADGTATAIVHGAPSAQPALSTLHPIIFTNANGQGWFPPDFRLLRMGDVPLILDPGHTALLAISGANSAVIFHYGVRLKWDEVARS